MNILCCKRRQRAKLFQIVPTSVDVKEEYVLYLKRCRHCLSERLEIISYDYLNKKTKKNIKKENIKFFLLRMNIIWQPKKILPDVARSKFNLRYQEYGRVMKCYSSLSSMELGKIETDPFKSQLPYTLKVSKR